MMGNLQLLRADMLQTLYLALHVTVSQVFSEPDLRLSTSILSGRSRNGDGYEKVAPEGKAAKNKCYHQVSRYTGYFKANPAQTL